MLCKHAYLCYSIQVYWVIDLGLELASHGDTISFPIIRSISPHNSCEFCFWVPVSPHAHQHDSQCECMCVYFFLNPIWWVKKNHRSVLFFLLAFSLKFFCTISQKIFKQKSWKNYKNNNRLTPGSVLWVTFGGTHVWCQNLNWDQFHSKQAF